MPLRPFRPRPPLHRPPVRRPLVLSWPAVPSRPTALAAALVAAVFAPATALANGMPQLDFATPLTLDQVWWGAGIFIVFLLLAWRWGLPQVASVLEQRASSIAADLDAARGAKAAADRAAAEVTAATAAARAEAQGAISAAVDAANQQAAAQAAILNARLDAQLAQAETQIAVARAAALGALRQVATETAATVVARLTGSMADPARLDRAVTAALAGRGLSQRSGQGQSA